MLAKLGYDKNLKVEYNMKRLVGLWLILIGVVILISTLVGGRFVLNPYVFMIGYGVSIYLVEFNKPIKQKLIDGEITLFQKKMAKYGDTSLFILIFIIAGPFIPSSNWRMMWMGTFLATGIHFLIFYYVHGKSMIYLAIILSTFAVAGMTMKQTSFFYFGIIDGMVKAFFGIYLLFFTKTNMSKS